MQKKTKLFYLVPVLALLLQGCETAGFRRDFSEQQLEKIHPQIKTLDEEKQRAFTHYKGAFLGKQVSYSEVQQQLLRRKVSFHSQVPVALATVLDTLADQTHSSYRINNDVPGGGDAKNSGVVKRQNVNFDGTFEQFMRYIATLYDVDVNLRDDSVLDVQVYRTYIVNMDFFGEKNTYEAGLDMSGNEATSGGVKGKSETSFQSTFWEDVENMVKQYVSSGVYNIFKDVGAITFSGRPSEYATLSRVLRQFKETNNRQVVVAYKVFILDKSKEKSFEAGLGVSLNTGHTQFGFPQITSSKGLNLDFSGGKLTSLSAKLDALYKLAGSRILQSGEVITRNNVAVPLNLSESQNYIASITDSTPGAAGGANLGIYNTKVETSTITTGTSVILTPRILSDGRIQVVSAFTKKDLKNPDDFSSSDGTGGNRVQLPRVSTTEMFNTVDVLPGTIIMVGKYEVESYQDNRGVHILGGNTGTQNTTQTVVMVLGVDYYNKPFTDNGA